MIPDSGNLPAPFTSFVGRRQEVTEIHHLLGAGRLLTLTGPGGVGKTRLALEAARTFGRAFPDGAWLVDLAPVRDPAAVASTAAGTVRVPDPGTRPVLDQLTGYLARQRTLLILDNCEHLIGACAELARALLSAAPDLRILTTSRHVLGVTGEHVLGVSPLPSHDAVELLRHRAKAIRPDFSVGPADQAEVSRLCADLEGLPLAIELAASRLRSLTVRQLTERLENRFTLLTGKSRTAPSHQRTLRGVIDWSHELCDPAERLLWSRLSVFAGGFTLEAAEEVCAGGAIARHEVADLLDRLVGQSVVLTYETEGRPRYRLLEIVRRYGRERLVESGQEGDLRLRHRDFFLTLAEHVDRHWYGSGQVESLARLRAEQANLLTALECDADPRTGLRLVTALSFHWCAGGFLSEGRSRFERALALAPEPTAERARALLAATWVAQTQGDLAAADLWLDEAETVAERLDDPAVTVQAGGFRGVSAHYRGRPQESIERYEHALATMTALGDEREAASWLLALACVQAYAGDPRAALTGHRMITAAEASGERWGRAQVLMALGHDAWSRGERETTGTLARSALECMRGFNDFAMVARMLELLAWANTDGAPTFAAGLLGAADRLWRDAGTSIAAFGPQMVEHHARCEAAVIDALGQTAYAAAHTDGGRIGTPVRAVDLALAQDAGTDSDTDTDTGRTTVVLGASDSVCPLSCREREVAALVARGLSNRQIAAELVLSPRTADRHVENILAKLGFRSRARIAAWWTANQVLTP
ncbi:ATP-binding protein [Streptomyces fuscichromogenes]|uniref:LuxR family transcriptional regulator n=1 Tax=Streptomyces fuscichromogenes TaxID=1324013 RepID=A0A917X9U4_9ACTN|nr:LuxR C-terminal-related transcriptional regulator [Streptomyces fuscichromogenes]GGM98515.1 LuxR family transcriptional regulator [Streptomyces fuscichromogenes]